MKQVKEICEKLNLERFTGDTGLNRTITGAYTCDLLSDVMGHAGEGNVWITLQTHKNVIAVASLRDLACIILVNGLKPDADMLEQALVEGIAVLGSTENAFSVSGKLFKLLDN